MQSNVGPYRLNSQLLNSNQLNNSSFNLSQQQMNGYYGSNGSYGSSEPIDMRLYGNIPPNQPNRFVYGVGNNNGNNVGRNYPQDAVQTITSAAPMDIATSYPNDYTSGNNNYTMNSNSANNANVIPNNANNPIAFQNNANFVSNEQNLAQIQPIDSGAPKTAWDYASTNYGAAILTMITLAAMLIIWRPRLIMDDVSKHPYQKEYVINWTALVIWVLVGGAIVLAITPAANYFHIPYLSKQ